MAKKRSRRLVIDADVASAAGGKDAVHPMSMHCRDFLEAVLANDHYLVMTAEMSEEWARHQSGFARSWRVRMYARKRIVPLTLDTNRSLTAKLERARCSPGELAVMLKDVHILDAARATDQTIASRDTAARRLFGRASTTIQELRTIVWVDPDEPAEEPIAWLEAGAPAEPERMLGSSRK